MDEQEPWNWPAVAAELRPLVEQLRPDDALAIIKGLVNEPKDEYLAAYLAGAIRGTIQRQHRTKTWRPSKWRHSDEREDNYSGDE